MTISLPALTLDVKNIHGTLRYYPACPLSRALVTIKNGKKMTYSLDDINTLHAAGFPIHVYDHRGRKTEI